MRVIYKFPLAALAAPQMIEMPEDAEILHVHEQWGDIVFWAEVDTAKPYVDRLFRLSPTGVEVHGLYLGTAHVSDGIVLHLYDVDAE